MISSTKLLVPRVRRAVPVERTGGRAAPDGKATATDHAAGAAHGECEVGRLAANELASGRVRVPGTHRLRDTDRRCRGPIRLVRDPPTPGHGAPQDASGPDKGDHDGQEACICDLTGPLGLSQPTVSHHMKVLVDAGLLAREKRGRWAYFRAVPQAFESLAQALQPASSNVSERRKS
jgi:DNA-binding transcriptional ArsR family regulator